MCAGTCLSLLPFSWAGFPLLFSFLLPFVGVEQHFHTCTLVPLPPHISSGGFHLLFPLSFLLLLIHLSEEEHLLPSKIQPSAFLLFVLMLLVSCAPQFMSTWKLRTASLGLVLSICQALLGLKERSMLVSWTDLKIFSNRSDCVRGNCLQSLDSLIHVEEGCSCTT